MQSHCCISMLWSSSKGGGRPLGPMLDPLLHRDVAGFSIVCYVPCKLPFNYLHTALCILKANEAKSKL